MAFLLLLVLVLAPALAGCPPARVDELQCGVTPSDALVACPSEAALVKHLRERWGVKPHVAIAARCVPGKFGGAGWIVHATARDGATVAGALFILQPSCGALTDAALRPGELREGTYEAIDLDGDGVDEVMLRYAPPQPAGALQSSTLLEAMRVSSGRLHRAGSVTVEYAGATTTDGGAIEQVRCTSTVRYPPRPEGGFFLELESTRSAPSDFCLPDGVHRFELALHGLRRR